MFRIPTTTIATLLLVLLFLTGCQPLMTNRIRDRISASNERDWSPDMATLPTADFVGDVVHVHNIRNNQYLSADDFIVNHYDRTVRIADIQSVDFVVVPFKQTPALAHTLLSFGLSDGTYLGVSVEVRKEKSEKYQPLLGLGNQYELMYVVADERDLIRLRTEHREDSVYVFPTVANAKQSQDLFVDVMHRVNQLAANPEFYHSIGNNCTTNLVEHVNNLKEDKVPFSWKVLLPGFSAKYAYDHGLLDNRLPFEELELLCKINDLAAEHSDSDDFSRLIRSKRHLINRAVARTNSREQDSNGRVLY